MSAARGPFSPPSLPLAAPGRVPDAVLTRDEPCVLRGLLAHWPLVQAASRGLEPALAELRTHWADATVGVFRMAPETRGRIAYLSDFSGFNFSREFMPFGRLLEALQAQATEAEPTTLYMGSTTLDACLPGFRASHPLQLSTPEEPLASLWLGNRVCVPAHQDWPSNLACCVAGQRHFTLFPPDAVADLYIGPLEFTPAGQPISLVDAAQPDLQRFPRYAAAQARALHVTLEPGDALFIPSLWWHQVESTSALGGLVNYWWRRSPAWLDSPTHALWMALATVRDLPQAERQAWRALFEHYVFQADAHTAEHLPPPARGLLAPLDETGMRRLRALLLNKLNR
jgi:hypothetical protein